MKTISGSSKKTNLLLTTSYSSWSNIVINLYNVLKNANSDDTFEQLSQSTNIGRKIKLTFDITANKNFEGNLNIYPYQDNGLSILWGEDRHATNIISGLTNGETRHIEYEGYVYYKFQRENWSKGSIIFYPVNANDRINNNFRLDNTSLVYLDNPKKANIINKLPSTYQELEYIESTGTQYIDTEFKLNKTDNFSLEFNSNLKSGNVRVAFASTFSLTETNSEWFEITASNKLRYGWAGINLYSNVALTINQDFNVVFKHYNGVNTIFLNSVSVAQGNDTRITTSENNLILFKDYRTGVFSGKLRTYNISIFINDSLAHKYIPARRKSDSVLGLYDTVNNVFYTNAGTGTFLSGPEVGKGKVMGERIPSTYQRLNYIESNGGSLINTGFLDGLKVTVDCHMYLSSAYSNYLYGSTQNENYMSYNGLYNNSYLEYNWLTISRTASNDIIMNQRISGSNTIITINEIITTVATGTVAPSGNMWIFGCNNGRRYYGNGLRCYFFKIYDNNIMVRNFFPVRRRSDGVVGMYDTVNQQFYTNAGTGAFIAGPEVN